MQQIISSAIMRMTSIEIAELVGKRHDNVKRTIETLVEQAVISLPQIEEVKIQRDRRLETSQAYIFEGEKGKRDSIVVVAQLSPQFTARLVDRWAELEQGLAVPVNQSNAVPIEHAKHYIDAAGAMCDVLRLSNSSRTAVVRDVVSSWPILANAVPAYAIDAPSDSVIGSSEVTLPITEIVRGLTSAAKANVALEKAGLIVACYRNRSNGEQSKFWSVTEDGLKYGKNQTHERNQRETQPHWYACKSDEIVKIVTDNLG